MANRILQPELMDDPALDGRAHRRALSALGRINRLSRTASQYARRLRSWAGEAKELRVLDVACGGGDVALDLECGAARLGLPLRIEGCDSSPAAVDFARSTARYRGSRAGFFVRDVVREGLPEGYDVLICSLFLHHLNAVEAEKLLREMAAVAALGLMVGDLDRRRPGLWLAAVVPRLLSRSPVVHVDALRSVRAAFSVDELSDLAERAGLSGFALERTWPVRWILTWRQP